MNTVESGAYAFLAESQEVLFVSADPVFDKKAETHTDVLVEGVFSSYANAEAALDKRLARFRGVSVIDQFQQNSIGTDGPSSWTRNVTWDGFGHPAGDQTCWQQIKRIKIDGHTS